MRQKQTGSKKGLIDYLTARKRSSFTPEGTLNLARNHLPFLHQLDLMKKLPVHSGCVNTICWNKTGEYILSGSDDGNLCITKPTYMFDTSPEYTVLHKVQTRHLGNIFTAQFMPNSHDSVIVSASSDGPVIVHNIYSDNPSDGLFTYNCHFSVIYEVVPIYDQEKVFLSCGEDKTIRLFDLRCHKSCPRSSTCPHPALIKNSHAMTTIALHPMNSNLLLTGRADGLGLVYDRRKLPDVSKFSREQAHRDYLAGRPNTLTSGKFLHPLEGVVSQFSLPDTSEKNRFTSLCYSRDAKEILASFSQDYIYLFSNDSSSNVELIQTLSKRNRSRSAEMETDDGGEPNNDAEMQPIQESSSQSGQTSGNRASTRNGRRQLSMRGPKIRMRGDWSDTGIHSVPYSSRSPPNRSNRPTSVLQRLVGRVRSGSWRNRPLAFIPMADLLEAAPDLLEVSPSLFSDIYNRDRRSESNSEVDAQESSSNTRTDSETTATTTTSQPDHPSRLENDLDQNEEMDQDSDADSDDDINLTVEWADEDDCSPDHSGEHSDDILSDTDKDENSSKPKISSETKEKFRRTIGQLKSKYSRIPVHHPHICYQGHRNCRTSIKEAIFWGDDYIMSGSDCGRIIVWEKRTAKLVMGFPADTRVVNCLAPNPQTYALASSGIDYDIKLWSTQNINEGPLRMSDSEIESIIKNNELMLEESKQTITVPPHLFFRILATFASSD